MVRKTREQVWRELDQLGEDEVRERLAASTDDPADTRLVRQWLERKERVASELSATAADVEAGRSGRSLRMVGGVALIALSAAALGYIVARRRRR
jgi:type VI protein secretion system component VasF